MLKSKCRKIDTEKDALIISSSVHENYLYCKKEAVSIFYFRFFFYVLKK